MYNEITARRLFGKIGCKNHMLIYDDKIVIIVSIVKIIPLNAIKYNCITYRAVVTMFWGDVKFDKIEFILYNTL